MPFELISRICNETAAEYSKRRNEAITKMKNSHSGWIEDHETMKGGVLLWWEGQHIGYYSNHGLVTERSSKKERSRRY